MQSYHDGFFDREEYLDDPEYFPRPVSNKNFIWKPEIADTPFKKTAIKTLMENSGHLTQLQKPFQTSDLQYYQPSFVSRDPMDFHSRNIHWSNAKAVSDYEKQVSDTEKIFQGKKEAKYSNAGGALHGLGFKTYKLWRKMRGTQSRRKRRTRRRTTRRKRTRSRR